VAILIQGDILSADLITYVLKTHNIDTIMHFAAQSHVGTPRNG
jgi:UDP-glucose 4-epimerase